MRIRTKDGGVFNGKTGEVGDFDAGKERWIVTVDERKLSLKIENLEFCCMYPLLQVILVTSSVSWRWTRKKKDAGPVAGEFKNVNQPFEA